MLREAIKGDTFIQALSVCLPWSMKNSHHTSCGNNPAIRTGEKGWSFVDSLWRTIASLMRPWCNEGERPSAANVILHGDLQSQVRCHSDDEPLLGHLENLS